MRLILRIRILKGLRKMPDFPAVETPAPPVDEMTDRQLLEEIVRNMRMLGQVLQQIGNNPGLSAMLGIKL
jgi:hypothetical protein